MHVIKWVSYKEEEAHPMPLASSHTGGLLAWQGLMMP